jgi:hypothetical protein
MRLMGTYGTERVLLSSPDKIKQVCADAGKRACNSERKKHFDETRERCSKLEAHTCDFTYFSSTKAKNEQMIVESIT